MLKVLSVAALAAAAILYWPLAAAQKPNPIGPPNDITMAKDFVMQWEGVSLRKYTDTAGFITIGWGHTADGFDCGPSFEEIREPISLSLAEDILLCDLANAKEVVLRYVTVPLDENRLAAAIGLAFNIGEDMFSQSSFVRDLNAGRSQRAANDILRFVLITDPETGKKRAEPGLVLRRMAERALFLGF